MEDTRQLTLTLLQAVQTRTDVPLLASGGLMTPQDVQAVLQAGAVAAQCGTPFLLVHEASTSAP
ncbi:nitronate monooxygenase [Deinococcus radiophilus]|uniref:nitronate monooxygenase n=1 Tax=Deinococcus radiophilus TaxID=32062 RepID=UPI0014757F05|nr:nitronate monooxygenase [Deinococcus radiophilus]UFA50235.1 nitronate monooxygenase [Deinococcus radiophilus]